MAQKRAHDNNDGYTNKKNKSSKHWALGLLDSMNDPKLQVKSDDLIVIIKDKYPKAKFHYLVLPKENISNLKVLKEKHLSLLEHMEAAAKELIQEEKHKKSAFKFGYHAEASMFRLHMHVISDDMNSECLKTKKHWNTFTTGFFINAEVVREDLKKCGKISLPSSEKLKEYLNMPLSCHKCDYKPKNIPTLKSHIITHVK